MHDACHLRRHLRRMTGREARLVEAKAAAKRHRQKQYFLDDNDMAKRFWAAAGVRGTCHPACLSYPCDPITLPVASTHVRAGTKACVSTSACAAPVHAQTRVHANTHAPPHTHRRSARRGWGGEGGPQGRGGSGRLWGRSALCVRLGWVTAPMPV